MVDTFYQHFILFDNYATLVGFKIGENFVGDTGLDLVVGGGRPYI